MTMMHDDENQTIQSERKGDIIQIRATRQKLRAFISLILRRLNSRYYNDPTLTGFTTYNQWIDDGIANINSRFELRKIVLGSTAGPQEKPADTIRFVIERFKWMFPFLSEDFEFRFHNQGTYPKWEMKCDLQRISMTTWAIHELPGL